MLSLPRGISFKFILLCHDKCNSVGAIALAVFIIRNDDMQQPQSMRPNYILCSVCRRSRTGNVHQWLSTTEALHAYSTTTVFSVKYVETFLGVTGIQQGQCWACWFAFCTLDKSSIHWEIFEVYCYWVIFNWTQDHCCQNVSEKVKVVLIFMTLFSGAFPD